MNTPENRPPPLERYSLNHQPIKTSGFAVTSMIMGILSILGGAILFVPPLLAVIFGHVAVNVCKKNLMLGGKGMAIAGLVMGWICLAGWIFFILTFGGLAMVGISSHFSNASQQVKISDAQKNARNLAAVAAAARASGYTDTWATKDDAIKQLKRGILVNNLMYTVEDLSDAQLHEASKYLKLKGDNLEYVPWSD